MKKLDILEIFGNAGMYVLTGLQTKEIFEIISLVLSILISILIIVTKIISWFKEAKKDGKIDSDELGQLVDITKDGLEDVKDKIDEKKGDENKDGI